MRSSMPRVFLALIGLMVLSTAPAMAADLSARPVCAAAVDTVLEAWHAVWPAWPATKPGQAMVEDSAGHRHSLSEYDAMRRRFRLAREECSQNGSEQAMAELRIVSAWLGDDTLSGRMIVMAEPE